MIIKFIKLFSIFFTMSIMLYCTPNRLKVEYYENGRKKNEGQMINGKKNGKWKFWYEDGTIMAIESYKNGILDGLSEFFYENGQLKDSASYNMGKVIGQVKAWHENGQLNSIVTYDDKGKMNGLTWIWQENGILLQEGCFKNDQMDGEWKDYYYSSGRIRMKHHYINGKQVGKWIYFRQNGDTLKVEQY